MQYFTLHKILTSTLKEDLSSDVIWLHCVSKYTGHSYNNLYPVKNKKYFQWEKKLSLCLSFCNFESEIFGVTEYLDSWRANPKGLTVPISTVRAILKKFKATGTVTDLPENGPMFILSPCTARRIRDTKKSPRITARESTAESSILGSLSPQNYHYTSPSCQQIIWKACQKKAFPVISPQT